MIYNKPQHNFYMKLYQIYLSQIDFLQQVNITEFNRSDKNVITNWKEICVKSAFHISDERTCYMIW